jgi:hypothetical protein
MENAALEYQEPPTADPAVLRLAGLHGEITALLTRYGLELVHLPSTSDIEGSYWGDEEAGLVDNRLLARDDTPIHSILHEACHYICMDPGRRHDLHTDAGGGYDEENGVCYLQILLADELPDMGRERMFSDMDTWGYSFRLGSTRSWFEHDADDAKEWLSQRGLINAQGRPTGHLRAES